MSVPRLTIPESAFDPAAFLSILAARRRTSLFQFLLKLTNGSAAFLVLAYVIGLVGLKPLIETTAFRRLDYLEHYRNKLRDLYLNIINRVNHVPIIGLHHDGSGKIYAEAVCQTDLSQANDHKGNKINELGLANLAEKLRDLQSVLSRCLSFSLDQMPHYRLADFALKDFQLKTDMTFFSHKELFTKNFVADGKPRLKHVAQEAKGEIRSIKGLYMSGQV